MFEMNYNALTGGGLFDSVLGEVKVDIIHYVYDLFGGPNGRCCMALKSTGPLCPYLPINVVYAHPVVYVLKTYVLHLP